MDAQTRDTIRALGYSDTEITAFENGEGQTGDLIAQTKATGTRAAAAEPTGQLAERPDGPILLSDLWRYYKPDGAFGAFTMAEKQE